MIFDSLDRLGWYFGNSEVISKVAACFLELKERPSLPKRVDIVKDRLYVIGAEYAPRDLSAESRMEAHKRYVDIAYMAEGEELIYCKLASDLKNVTEPYSFEKDALFGDVDDDAFPVRLSAGRVVALFPQDAHCPACKADGCNRVKKLICKMDVKYLNSD